MADFDSAARRMAADHSRLRSKARSRGSKSSLSVKAKREAEQRKKREEIRRREREDARRRTSYVVRYMAGRDGELGVVRSLRGGGEGTAGGNGVDGGKVSKAPSSGGGLFGSSAPVASWSGATKTGLMLSPTSVHGDGDKIALPSSVLSVLAERGMMEGGGGGGQQPLTFRIGVLREGYAFPSSAGMRDMLEKAPTTDGDDPALDDGETDDMDVDDENDDHDDAAAVNDGDYQPTRTAPYLAELSRRYVTYTHGTVVEFTQEEGCVGLPRGIAEALLDPERQRAGADGESDEVVVVPSTRTVDPAAASASAATEENGEVGEESAVDENGDGAVPMQQEAAVTTDAADNSERTPGHPAYGLFDVPASTVEITLLRLPKGKRCKLIPTEHSVRSGFYALKDVKMVLEQSLIRTRATLSVGDVVHAWHRGKKFDLRVGGVQPPHWGAVSCINTDIEVDIAAPEEEGEERGAKAQSSSAAAAGASPAAAERKDEAVAQFAPGQGRRLTDDDAPAPDPRPAAVAPVPAPSARTLPPEPPADLREGVCVVQIRGNGLSGRRRFLAASATMKDVFAFASSLFAGGDGDGGSGGDATAPAFRLVTRFPRRSFELGECGSKTMEEAGVGGEGQEAFMVEMTS